MNTHNIRFYGGLMKIILQLSSNIPLSVLLLHLNWICAHVSTQVSRYSQTDLVHLIKTEQLQDKIFL